MQCTNSQPRHAISGVHFHSMMYKWCFESSDPQVTLDVISVCDMQIESHGALRMWILLSFQFVSVARFRRFVTLPY